jgi:hypothetical protein
VQTADKTDAASCSLNRPETVAVATAMTNTGTAFQADADAE